MRIMKNIKLTLATTLSVIALSFTGNAFADGDRDNNHFERQADKSNVQKLKNKRYDSNKRIVSNNRAVSNKKITKRVVVKNSPTRKVVITKTIINKPAKVRYAQNKRFQHVKRFNKQYSRYQKRASYDNRYKHYNQKKVNKQRVYSVRPGDTLIQVSYKTGVSIHRLARLNRIKNRDLNHLRVGQILRLV